MVKNFLAREPCLLSTLNINYLEPVFTFWPGEGERIESHSFQGNGGGAVVVNRVLRGTLEN